MAATYNCNDWPNTIVATNVISCEFDSTIFGSVITEEVFKGTKISIDLDSNNLSGDLTGLGLDSAAWYVLSSISLRNNSLTGSIPATIGNLATLTVLDLSSNNLTGKIPQTFSLLRNLRTVQLGGNSFEGCVPCPLYGKIDCVANSGTVGIQRNGAILSWCNNPTRTSTPASILAGGTNNGTATFATNSEFVVVMSSLAGSLLFLLISCLLSAIFLRQKRLLRQVIAGDPAPEQSNLLLSEASPTMLRDDSSRGRQGALSFDGRDGWRSDQDLRLSTRGSRTSSIVG
jgi:hypothetical protein